MADCSERNSPPNRITQNPVPLTLIFKNPAKSGQKVATVATSGNRPDLRWRRQKTNRDVTPSCPPSRRDCMQHCINMKTCLKCDLVNPDNATRCDCGFEFSRLSKPSLKTDLQAELSVEQRESAANALRGILAGLGAVALSLITYAIAKPGQRFILFYGAAAVGLAKAGHSLVRLLNIQSAKRRVRKYQRSDPEGK